MTKKIKAAGMLILLLAIIMLAPVGTALAAGWWDTANQGGLDVVGQAYGQTGVASESNDIRLIIARIIRIVLQLLGLIFLVLIIMAGFRWMTAGGDEDKVATARKQLTNSVIGLVIILAAWAITVYVTKQIMFSLTGVMPISWSW